MTVLKHFYFFSLRKYVQFFGKETIEFQYKYTEFNK